jgi:hypothetical protein
MYEADSRTFETEARTFKAVTRTFKATLLSPDSFAAPAQDVGDAIARIGPL